MWRPILLLVYATLAALTVGSVGAAPSGNRNVQGLNSAFGPYVVRPVAPENSTTSQDFVYEGMTDEDQSAKMVSPNDADQETVEGAGGLWGNYSQQIAEMKTEEADTDKMFDKSQKKAAAIDKKESAMERYMSDELTAFAEKIRLLNMDMTARIDAAPEVPGVPGPPGIKPSLSHTQTRPCALSPKHTHTNSSLCVNAPQVSKAQTPQTESKGPQARRVQKA